MDKNIKFEGVIKVSEVKKLPEFVYNIKVKKNNNYFANRVLVHNCDETGEIDDETYAKLYRMLLDSKVAVIVELGNPWHLNHFYKHKYDDDWDFTQISYLDAVREGRITMEEVEEQRKEMTDIEFRVMMESDFPPDVEFAIFTEEGHIAKAIREKDFKVEDMEKILIGTDPAKGGRDRSSLLICGELKGEIFYLEDYEWNISDEMLLTGRIREVIDKYPKEKIEIKGDIIQGKGVIDRLNELGYNTAGYTSGKKARNKRYYNLKTETVFGLAKIMYDGRFWNLPYNSKLTLQLKQWTYEVRSDKQLKVIDPSDSPDLADGLNMCVADIKGGKFSTVEEGLSFKF